MGETKGVYNAEYSVGTWVRVVEREKLDEFQVIWKWHHPLDPRQKEFAGHRAQVEGVSYYHGGDELYVLRDIPGIWHEVCLERDPQMD